MDPLANDPIMWEVDDGTGNAHVETKKKIKSKSKGSTLLNKIKGGDNPHDGVPHKRTGKKMTQKEIERRVSSSCNTQLLRKFVLERIEVF